SSPSIKSLPQPPTYFPVYFCLKLIIKGIYLTCIIIHYCTGIVGTIPAAIGLLLGGAYLTCLQPGPRQLTSFITIVEILGTMGYVSAFFLGCPPTPFAALPKDNAND